MVEEKADEILSEADHAHVAFLVVGDPFGYAITMPLLPCFSLSTTCIALLIRCCIILVRLWFCFFPRATTHTDLVVRAKKMAIEVKVVHNASVMNAIGVCGLQLYRYGETVSIPFFTETWRPDSFYEKIQRNLSMGLHTLCLLGNSLLFVV